MWLVLGNLRPSIDGDATAGGLLSLRRARAEWLDPVSSIPPTLLLGRRTLCTAVCQAVRRGLGPGGKCEDAGLRSRLPIR